MTVSIFVSPKQKGKAFISIYPLQSPALSGSMLIILEQLNGLAVWVIIHSNILSLCWSIAKDVVQLKRFICSRGADGSDRRESITTSPHFIDSTACVLYDTEKCPHFFQLHTTLFIYFLSSLFECCFLF